MARKVNKIDNTFGKFSLNVTARPVDTYVSPARPREADDAGGEFMQLAQALSTIHAPLTTYLKTKQDEKHERDIVEGEKAYLLDGNRRSIADYMAANPELPISEGFKEGFSKGRATNEAALLNDAMYQAYTQGEAKVTLEDGTVVDVRSSDDPKIFARWSQEFIAKHVTENMDSGVAPLAFSQIFLPQAQDFAQKLAGEHLGNREADWKFKALNEYTTTFVNVMDVNISDGAVVADGEEGSMRIANHLSFLTKDLRAKGFTTEETVSSLATALIGVADKNDITDIDQLLDIASNIEIADGITLGSDTASMIKLTNKIYAQQSQKEERRRQEKRELKEKQEEATQSLRFDIMREAVGKGSVSAVMGRIMNEYATQPDVTPEALAEFTSRVHSLVSNSKPERDPFAAMNASLARATRVAAEQNKFMHFVLANGGVYTEQDLADQGISEEGQTMWLRGLLGVQSSEKEQRANDLRFAQGIAATGLGLDDNTAGGQMLALGIGIDVTNELEKWKKANPELKNDPVETTKAMLSIYNTNSAKFAERRSALPGFIEGGGDPTDTAALDEAVTAQQARAEAATWEAESRKALVADLEIAAEEYRRGNTAELEAIMQATGLTEEDIERDYGVRIRQPKGIR